MRSKPPLVVGTAALFAILVLAQPASAELIFFSPDRSISVERYRIDGERIIVQLRGGGEIEFDRAIVTEIRPDEAPYPVTAPAIEPTVVELPYGQLPNVQLMEKTPFDPIIEGASRRHGIAARLVKAVIQVESSFDPRARSPKGAKGLMQLMPATARQYKARNVFDPAINIEAGTKYLRDLMSRFDLPLALAAYNAGEAAVLRYGGIPPFPETQAYVSKVLSLTDTKFLPN